MSSFKNITDALTQLSPGRVPLGIFNEIARLSVVPVVELLIILDDKILLVKRQADDLYWPNQYCLPGKIVSSASHKVIEDYVIGLCERFNITGHDETIPAGIKLYTTRRGIELAIIYKLEINDDIDLEDRAQFVSIDEIEQIDIIPEHKDIINGYRHNKI